MRGIGTASVTRASSPSAAACRPPRTSPTHRDAGRVGVDVIGILAEVLVDIAPEVGIAADVGVALEVLVTIEVVESGDLFLSVCVVLCEQFVDQAFSARWHPRAG